MTHEATKEKLTPVQDRFCKEYPVDWEGVGAYMRASGTSNRKSAGVQACKLLKMDKVQDKIKLYVQEALGPLEKDLIENVQFWIDIRDGKIDGQDAGKVIPLDAVLEILSENGYTKDDDIFKAVNEMLAFRIKHATISEQLKASEHLAKYRAMFIDKKEVAIAASIVIEDDIK